MAVSQAGVSIAVALGLALGGFLTEVADPRAAYVVCGGLGVLGVAVVGRSRVAPTAVRAASRQFHAFQTTRRAPDGQYREDGEDQDRDDGTNRRGALPACAGLDATGDRPSVRAD